MFKPRTIEEAQTDYLAALSEAGNAVDIDLSPTSPLYVLARANASIISLQELRLSSVLLANNVLTASSAELDELALSIVERGEATYSTGYVFIPPTSSQITLPVGTIFTELASGLQVVSQESKVSSTLVGTTVLVQAASRGSVYNISAGTRLFSQSYPEINFIVASTKLPNGKYEGSLVGGRDSETDSSLRERLLSRLVSVNQPASKNFLRQELLAYPGVSRAYVKTRVGGIVEVWVNTVEGFTSEELISLRDYVLPLIPAGIILALNTARIKSFPLSLKVVPFTSSLADLTSLTLQISSTVKSFVSSLDIADSVPLSRVEQLVKPLVQSVKVVSPLADVTAELDQILILSSLDISYPA